MTLAKEAVIGQFNCSTPHDFYNKLIGLHYCRIPQVDAIQFVLDVFLVVYFQVPKYYGGALVATMEKYHSGISTQLTGNDPSTLVDDNDEPVDWESVFPFIELQIAQFCVCLRKAACQPTL